MLKWAYFMRSAVSTAMETGAAKLSARALLLKLRRVVKDAKSVQVDAFDRGDNNAVPRNW